MSTANVNFSINNLPQVDRHLNDVIRVPDVTHSQNTERMLDDVARKLTRPVEISHTEQRIVDPGEHNSMTSKKKGKKGDRKKNQTVEKKQRRSDSGHFVDIEG
jgi:hypothetical protein